MDDILLQAIRQAVRDEVKVTVNGKIDSLRTEFDTFQKQMKPVSSAFNGWIHFRAQAMFWIGGILAFGGAIQALQAIWGLISPHIRS